MQLSENISQAFKQYADLCLEGGFILDDENREQVQQVINLFEKNEAVCLQGNSGSGKTFLMEVLRRITNPKSKRHFIKLDTFFMVKNYNENYEEYGDKVLNQWDHKNILVNELGTEEKGKYGSEVMQKFILFRHELWERTKRKTHFTTNLSDQEICNRYGSFTHSRITAMCHFIKLGGSEDSTDRRPLMILKGFPVFEHPLYLTKKEKEWNELYRLSEQQAKEKQQEPTEYRGIGTMVREQFEAAFKTHG